MTEKRVSNHLDLLSGPWTGVWRQGGSNQGKESLDLVFQDGQVLGFGDDKDGQFQFTGTFDGTGGVCLGKVYTRPIGLVPARMTYAGRWNGRRILGTWSDDASKYNAGPSGCGPATDQIPVKSWRQRKTCPKQSNSSWSSQHPRGRGNREKDWNDHDR
jgi:hypothetical protein